MNKNTTRNHGFFDREFWLKKPPYGFFAPMSNLTKVPFWTSRFGLDYFDWVFWVGFSLLNHHDNNIIWATKKKNNI
jgi:hypothetical protein